MFLSMICWGSWANTFKLTRGVRFELFYWDYALGMAVSALLLAALLDTPAHCVASVSSVPCAAGFPSNLLTARTGALAQAAAAGVVFNLANLLLVAAIAIAGLAVAFPVAIGTALIIGTALTYFVDHKGAPGVIAVGVSFAAIAIVCCATAYRAQSRELAITGRGVSLCLISGLLMASWAPLAASSMRAATDPESLGRASSLGAAASLGPAATPLTPLSSFAVFAIAALLSTVPFNLHLMRRPLIDRPVSMRAYREGGVRWHLFGLLGGAVWAIGTASNLVAGNSVGFAVSYAIGQSAPLVASLWGIFVWKEFAGATPAATRALTAMFVFYVAAIGVLSRAA